MRRAGWGVPLALVCGLVGGDVLAAETEPSGSIAIVVGHASPIRGVTVDVLREVYLRRRRIWHDGVAALPVNLPADSSLRRVFSRRVLGRLPEDLESHWSRLAFEGVRPPAVLQSPQAVCAYVGVEPAGIGYVPPGEVDAASCRVLFSIDSVGVVR
jgi:hypothetical protein